MKKKVLDALQSFSRAMVQPVLLLSVLGLVAVIGVILTNSAITSVLPFLNNPVIAIPGTMLYSSILWVFQNLSIFFCIGIAAAYAKEDKHQAAFIGALAYVMYLVGNNTYLKMTGDLVAAESLAGTGQTVSLGMQVQDTGVLAGLVLGVLIGMVYRKYCNKSFRGAAQIFSGARFVVVLAVPTALLLAIAVAWIWPFLQIMISGMVGFIKGAGSLGIFFYAALERILIPTGLHHLVYSPFFFTEMGGVAEIGGQVYQGAMPVFLAELNDPFITKFSPSILYTGLGMSKVFGLTGATYAFYKCAYPENRERVKNILLPAVITSFMVGITEPLEFSFIFAAPVLFVVHAILAGLGLASLSVLGISASGMGGFIQQMIYNLTAGVSKTNWPLYLLIGIIQMLLYYVIFSTLIKKLNLKTLGREDRKNETSQEEKSFITGEKVAETIIRGLGGAANILDVQNCFTRLRVDVRRVDLVDDSVISQTECSGIIHNESNIQIVYGLQVGTIKKEVLNVLKGGNQL